MRKNTVTGRLTTLALLIAISVVLRLLGFPQNGTFRIELGFVPIAVAGSIFGPFWAGLSYLIADIIGTLCTGLVPAPTVTACKLLTGVLYGLCFYKRSRSLPKIILAATLVTVLVDLVAMPFALVPVMGGKSVFVILSDRLLASVFNFPLRIVSLWLCFKYLNPVIEKEVIKYGHH
ncbi:MAG: folate family ECF transporter S component [Clostridia bacterium]|nr:folate family ECF transporter S component [Clostridia bacterium]